MKVSNALGPLNTGSTNMGLHGRGGGGAGAGRGGAGGAGAQQDSRRPERVRAVPCVPLHSMGRERLQQHLPPCRASSGGLPGARRGGALLWQEQGSLFGLCSL